MRGDGDAACDGAGSRMQDRRRCGTNSGGSESMSVGSILPSSIPRLIKHCVHDAMGKVSFSLLQLALTALVSTDGAADRIESIQRLRAAGTDGARRASRHRRNMLLLLPCPQEVMRDVENFSRREGGEGFDIANRILDDAPPYPTRSLASAPGGADHPGPALSISLTAGGRDDG
ncbi:hypothetical protein CMUS01_10101 [Colletotrichum musicola]|uniref:Uncharacterized protein n=1 Tax=Colletotrichum musicola TaxID=2175873 RepID=A0A8H6K436_9PEZI|nr:hypothetical protein CMUS01_10101 [Colletotrichum musicola]